MKRSHEASVMHPGGEAMSTATLITAEQLLEMPENRWHELVAGELREMTPSSCRHAAVISRLDRLLGNHVEKRKLGAVLVEGNQKPEKPGTVAYYRGAGAVECAPVRAEGGRWNGACRG
jgi:hypothetical protein